MRILDKASIRLELDKLGFQRAGAQALPQGIQPGVRRRADDRPDRLGQVDHALRGAQGAQHAREEHHHDRGPGRVPARRHQPGAGQQQGRPHLRRRAALDPARRPGHHDGRRDPRPRDAPRSPSRRRSPATSCSPRCTPTTRRRRSPAWSRWASSRSWSPRRSTAWSPSASRARCAPHCKERDPDPGRDAAQARLPGRVPDRGLRAGGCARCGGTGYKGRIGLYEVMMMSEAIRSLALQRASADELGAAAARGHAPLREDGLDKVSTASPRSRRSPA